MRIKKETKVNLVGKVAKTNTEYFLEFIWKDNMKEKFANNLSSPHRMAHFLSEERIQNWPKKNTK